MTGRWGCGCGAHQVRGKARDGVLAVMPGIRRRVPKVANDHLYTQPATQCKRKQDTMLVKTYRLPPPSHRQARPPAGHCRSLSSRPCPLRRHKVLAPNQQRSPLQRNSNTKRTGTGALNRSVLLLLRLLRRRSRNRLLAKLLVPLHRLLNKETATWILWSFP